MTPKLKSQISKYNYIYIKDSRTFYAMTAEMPFQDDDIVDTYELIGRESLGDLPQKVWLKVSEILKQLN